MKVRLAWKVDIRRSSCSLARRAKVQHAKPRLACRQHPYGDGSAPAFACRIYTPGADLSVIHRALPETLPPDHGHNAEEGCSPPIDAFCGHITCYLQAPNVRNGS